ncbi:hypothetical protein OHAE_1309 [Ochrobactrum soli]|uniref:Uncharacterized protein n=1 Tax=Ochrobactrum soli TaxID=2448455 RepID=A0A2P9HMW4_9HYPH|nr:hypothetical protein OHAE_1309 [[Ochrobactrum] soli]
MVELNHARSLDDGWRNCLVHRIVVELDVLSHRRFMNMIVP